MRDLAGEKQKPRFQSELASGVNLMNFKVDVFRKMCFQGILLGIFSFLWFWGVFGCSESELLMLPVVLAFSF